MVKSQESEFEVVVAAIAVGSALEEADFVVGAFQRAGGDRVIVPIQQADAMASQRMAHGAEDADAGGFGAAAPVVEELRGGGFGSLLSEQPQFVLEVVRLRQRFIELERFRQS